MGVNNLAVKGFDNTSDNGENLWGRVASRLEADLGATTYKRWLSSLSFAELSDTDITLTLPSKFQRDWVETHYRDKIFDLVSQEAGHAVSVNFAVENMLGNIAGAAIGAPVVTGIDDVQPAFTAETAPVALSAPLDPRFRFENFVVGKPNELAYAAALRVAEGFQPNLNPLFLYGGVGLGKTHLMHAIAWAIKEKTPERKVMYLSAEKFMYQFIRALRSRDTVSFKEQFRNVDVLMIDDVQFICGKDNTQEEFFQTFNVLIEQNKQIILSADKSPTDLEGLQDRLRSRLGWGLCADIHPTTYELRLGILQTKLENLKAGVKVPGEVLQFLAQKITNNVRELEGALNRLVAQADLVGRPVTLETAQEQLADLLRAYDRRVTIDDIQRRVAEHFNIKLTDMTSPRRARAVARPRQVAMYLAKTLTTRSLPEIGRKFGGRDHTTVLHAVRTIDKLCREDQTLADDVTVLERTLKN
ncbi:MAG: chromosomal replication initiator protein DnaA [Bdellovibrionales bacterium]